MGLEPDFECPADVFGQRLAFAEDKFAKAVEHEDEVFDSKKRFYFYR